MIKPHCDIKCSEDLIINLRKKNSLRYRYTKNILMKLTPKERVADIGCFGGVLYPYLKEAGCKKVEGFDIDKNSLIIAKRFYDKVYLWDCETQKAPVEEERYDVIIALEVIEHLNNVDNFLKEILRILKKGGYFIISTPNLVSIYNRFRILMGKLPFNYPALSFKYVKTKGLNISHTKIGNIEEWCYVFKNHNFKIKQISAIGSTFLTNIISKIYPKLGSTLFFILYK